MSHYWLITWFGRFLNNVDDNDDSVSLCVSSLYIFIFVNCTCCFQLISRENNVFVLLSPPPDPGKSSHRAYCFPNYSPLSALNRITNQIPCQDDSLRPGRLPQLYAAMTSYNDILHLNPWTWTPEPLDMVLHLLERLPTLVFLTRECVYFLIWNNHQPGKPLH